MYIYKYVDFKLGPAIGKKYTTDKNGKSYTTYIVDIGSTGDTLWKYYMRLGKSITRTIPKDQNEIVLKGNNYSIKPIKRPNGSIIKDRQGNIKYRIDGDDCPDAFKNDMILFIEIPNKNLDNIEYRIEGKATEIAKGYVGKERNAIISKSPAIVLEVTGDFKLISTGTNANKQKVEGCFSVKYDTADNFKYDYKETILQ